MTRFFVHLFTHTEGQMTPVTIGFKTIDNFHEKLIWQNGFSTVSNHILSIMTLSKLSRLILVFFVFFSVP